MSITKFVNTGDFYRYASNTDVSQTRIAKDGFEVIMNGYYSLDDIEAIAAKMKELQEKK